MLLKNKLISIIFLLVLFTTKASAVCLNPIIDPINSVDWSGIFPIRIGGITIKGANIRTSPSHVNSPICICSGVPGISAEFWEPARVIESVKDAYCFPTIGLSMNNPAGFFLNGSHHSIAGSTDTEEVSTQTHYYIFPIWAMLELFLDLPCINGDANLDIAYISEVDPTHNNCPLSIILNPEAVLFANPIAQLSCIADSIAANEPTGLMASVTDALFWCAGSWGSIYPLCQSALSPHFLEGNALVASRTIFKLGRLMLRWDPGLNYCTDVIEPIWVKTNLRLQVSRPVRGRPIPIGTSQLIWGIGKNPPFGVGGNAGDNFSWIIFRRHLCCLF